MDQNTNCIAVFTARSPNRLIREHGSQAWAMDPARARRVPYLVCVQNQNNPDRDFSDASEPHGAVFMVGKISDVVPSPEEPSRWLIKIDEYAMYTALSAWKGWRNPVKYTTLEEMGVRLEELEFHPVGPRAEELQGLAAAGVPDPPREPLNPFGKAPLPPEVPNFSIATAKAGLANFYGVKPEAIEIIIRG